jgi:molecular chaperone GrpE
MVKKKHIVVESDSHSTPHDSPTPQANPETVTQAVPDTADRVKELEEKLAEAIALADEKHDRMLRMAAELDNFRKRSAREMEELKKYANENLLHQLLTVVDNLERAIASAAAANKTDQQLVDGVALTLAEISKILEKHHVSPINGNWGVLRPGLPPGHVPGAADGSPTQYRGSRISKGLSHP